MDASKNFYIGIENSKSMRRHILEGSKEVVGMLKEYHKVDQIRRQKKLKIEQLKEHLKELNALIEHLDRAMPDMGIRAQTQKVANNNYNLPPRRAVTETPKSKTEIERLEEELKDLDSKLNNL